jgi:hypothetical protein
MNKRPIENLSNSFGGSKVMSRPDFLVQEADLTEKIKRFIEFPRQPIPRRNLSQLLASY